MRSLLFCICRPHPDREQRLAVPRAASKAGVSVTLGLFMGATLLLTWANAGHAFTTGRWLYEVEMPVAAQTAEERRRVAGQGILQVLTRLSGLVSIPRNETVQTAMENPGRYYNEFVFFDREDGEGKKQPYLRVVYQPDAVLTLARAARLPIWWNRRPQVMLWVVSEEQGRREIVDSNHGGELTQALTEHAALRGLPVILPIMDLDDRLAVSAGDIWGRVTNTLDDAAQRYAADLVLVGRIRSRQDADGQMVYQGDWQVWYEGRPIVTSAQQASAREIAAVGIDALADRLAEQFAVLPRGLQVRDFSISGLEDVSAYAALLKYLTSLDFIDRVSVRGVLGNHLSLQVLSHAEPEQLMMLLTAEGRLAPDDEHNGLGTGLIWQG